jgi:Fe-S-cluster containining protein
MDEQQKKCIECRECCEYVEFPVTMLSDDAVEYYVIRGTPCLVDGEGVLMCRVYQPCQHLTDTGCAVYDQVRPNVCTVFVCDEKSAERKANRDKAFAEGAQRLKALVNNRRKERGLPEFP